MLVLRVGYAQDRVVQHDGNPEAMENGLSKLQMQVQHKQKSVTVSGWAIDLSDFKVDARGTSKEEVGWC